MNRDHHSGLIGADLTAALLDALDKWERGGCGCCSPTPADDAFDELGIFSDEDGEMSEDSNVALAARLHRFALDLAYATRARTPIAALDDAQQGGIQ
jgi:hypothetical protein